MQDRHSSQEIAVGLCASQAAVPAKYLYDDLGSRLFDLITCLPEYYPTRTEAAVMAAHTAEIALAAGTGVALVDLGAGNCQKAHALFPLLRPRRYVAVDISVEYLDRALGSLHKCFPDVPMSALSADLSEPFELPDATRGMPLLHFFPGSSIGNLHPEDALALLRRLHGQCMGRGGLLVGIDLVKDAAAIHAAYNDALGVTAAFNRNLLNHVNALLGSDFRLSDWRHRACYDARRQRVGMELEATGQVTVTWPGGERCFLAGESIHTEYSYKYRLDDFEALMARAGFRNVCAWTDDRRWFAVCHGQA